MTDKYLRVSMEEVDRNAWNNPPCLDIMKGLRTRIVATVGPSCDTPDMLESLARTGASIFRLNFSHGDLESKKSVIKWIREVSIKVNKPISILGDLSGPKLRVGEAPNNAIALDQGNEFRLTSDPDISEDRRLSVNFAGLHDIIEVGRMILLDDGTVRLRVDKIDGHDVVCRALDNCVIKSRKGVNLPGTHLPIPALTDKDKADLQFALDHGVDCVALSFVRSKDDVEDALKIIKAHKTGFRTPLIAKIEQAEALLHLDDILEAADGAMVARGDLGVEIPIEEVPAAQRRIIRKCNHRGMPVITATQMLNSMIEFPTPTRAEVTDIYNAILQGTDAVMLSGETAAGKHPLKAVDMMARVIGEGDQDMKSQIDNPKVRPLRENDAVPEAICKSGVLLARHLGADAIICSTSGGSTAIRLSRYRPKCKLISFSSDLRVVRRLNLYWGVECHHQREVWESESELGESGAIMSLILQSIKEEKVLPIGARAVFIAGIPLGVVGSTNFIRVVDIE